MPSLLSVDQKQQRTDVCIDLEEHSANDPSFHSNVITGDKTWVYAYDPEPKLNPVSGKVRVTSTEEGTASEKQHQVNVDLFL